MGRGRDGTRIGTDGASHQGGGVNLGDLLRARGLVPTEPDNARNEGTGPDLDAACQSAPPAATAGGKRDDLPAFPARVVLRRERKGRGGRTVTRVQGLGWDDDALAELARRMARALGCGAGVEDGDVVLQGDLVTRAEAWLRAQGVDRVVR
jgi:translation initiation factor 1